MTNKPPVSEMRKTLRHCKGCGQEFWMAATGRPRLYCTARCRKEAWKARSRAEVPEDREREVEVRDRPGPIAYADLSRR